MLGYSPASIKREWRIAREIVLLTAVGRDARAAFIGESMGAIASDNEHYVTIDRELFRDRSAASDAIEKILKCLDSPSRAPPVSPAARELALPIQPF